MGRVRSVGCGVRGGESEECGMRRMHSPHPTLLTQQTTLTKIISDHIRHHRISRKQYLEIGMRKKDSILDTIVSDPSKIVGWSCKTQDLATL